MNTNLYIQSGNVYCGTRQLPVKEQRGRRYVHFEGRQINLKKIPEKEPPPDPMFHYLFGGGHISHPCHAMDYWILRWRMKHHITTLQYKKEYLHA